MDPTAVTDKAMVEIEKKYRLTTELERELIEKLRHAGAEFIREDVEENIIYRGDILADRAAIIRIRKTETSTLLTYKRRIESQASAKHQIEHETEISDPAAADHIMRELGLRPQLIYEKRRKIWRLRECEVVIDELPFGLFMEIEGNITSIKEAEMTLEIEDLETEQRTYPMLTASLGVRVNDVVEARFS